MTKDPNIILSIINLKLRDYYSDLESLKYDLEDAEEMISILENNGYLYNKEINQFRKK